MTQTKPTLLLYCLISCIYLLADHLDWHYLTIATKPMLLLVLLIYFLQSVPNKNTAVSKAMIGGLFFSFVGDTLLLFDGDLFFMLGLGSFLTTHLFYTKAFLNNSTTTFANLFLNRKIAVLLFMALVISLLTYLWPDLGGLRWPVLIYSMVISIMGLAAYNLRDRVPTEIFFLTFFGALLFIFSDSMIALDKFKTSQLNLPFPRLLIMIPYLVAQYLIVEGILKTKNNALTLGTNKTIIPNG